jgi:hypothetical protein
MKCFVCERMVTRLHGHHVNWDHRDNRPGNVVSVCGTCHRIIHESGWWSLSQLIDARSVVRGCSPRTPSGERSFKLG